MDTILYFWSILSLDNLPILSLVHFIVTSLALRREPGGYQFTQSHPIASCSINIIVSMSGSLITSLLVGKPLLDCLVNEGTIIAAVGIWYCINFFPGDLVFKLCQLPFIKYPLYMAEEVRRSKNVMVGVVMAAKLYPNSLLPLAVAGMFKGTGKKWSITFYRLLTGSELASQHELLSLSFTTKAGFIMGVVYSLNHTHQLLGLSNDTCVLYGALFLVTLQLYNMWFNQLADPLKGPQERVWSYMSFNCPSLKDHSPPSTTTNTVTVATTNGERSETTAVTKRYVTKTTT